MIKNQLLNQYITFYPKEKKFALSPKLSIHRRSHFVKDNLNPSLAPLANATSHSCSFNICK